MLEICSLRRGAVATSVASPRDLSAANPNSDRALTIDPHSHRLDVSAGNSFGMISFANTQIEKRPSILGPDNNPRKICKLAVVQQEGANRFKIKFLSKVDLQPLSNHIVHKKGGGYPPPRALALPNVYSYRQRGFLHAR